MNVSCKSEFGFEVDVSCWVIVLSGLGLYVRFELLCEPKNAVG